MSLGLTCLLGLTAGPRPLGRWIQDLAAADPAVRDAATDYLSDQGSAARPAVIAALATASPDVTCRLSLVLLRTIPWDPPPDADPDVRAALVDYATLSADDRAARVAALQGAGAPSVLMRVLTSDPSPSVRWSAANAVRLLFDGNKDLAAQVLALSAAPADPATYPPAADNGPLLAAAGWAALGTDPARADEMVGRALAIEVAHPSAFQRQSDHGPADFAFLWAADRASDRGDFAAAAVLLRELAARTAWSADAPPDPVADLFALHAEHGPFPGFEDDLRLYRPYLARPELMYCLARLAERQGGGLADGTAVALDGAALAAGGTSPDDHGEVGTFLYRHGWPAAADRELRTALWLAGPHPSAGVYFALYYMAGDRDDDAAAGRYLEGALMLPDGGGMEHVSRYGERTPWSEADAWAEVHWHYLRAAVTAGDRAEAQAQAQQLLDLDASGGVLKHDAGIGMAADLVPVLADAGRVAAADRCFDAAYAALRQQVEEKRDDAKNNLAWLCARSNRRLDEADRLSAEAVAAAPADAACLDTRAEVLSRTGRPREAVALEERALSVKPGDVYMQRQIARFRAEAAAAR